MEITRTTKIDFVPQKRDVDGGVAIQTTLMDLRRALRAVEEYGDMGDVIFHVGEDDGGYVCFTIEFFDGDGAKGTTKPKPVTRRTTVKP